MMPSLMSLKWETLGICTQIIMTLLINRMTTSSIMVLGLTTLGNSIPILSIMAFSTTTLMITLGLTTFLTHNNLRISRVRITPFRTVKLGLTTFGISTLSLKTVRIFSRMTTII
jgi:hypothetical protein